MTPCGGVKKPPTINTTDTKKLTANVQRLSQYVRVPSPLSFSEIVFIRNSFLFIWFSSLATRLRGWLYLVALLVVVWGTPFLTYPTDNHLVLFLLAYMYLLITRTIFIHNISIYYFHNPNTRYLSFSCICHIEHLFSLSLRLCCKHQCQQH